MANVDELMAEMSWVRRLARGLLHDADAADDVAQEAWLVANEHPPGDRPLRPWLHRVVLNLVRMRSRGENRRAVRELATEQRGIPTSAELLERVETQRMLADEVIALREPYRSTIVLRYVEGLSSAEIAHRLDIPPATVRQRLKHALDELRERIRAREDGPKRGWIAALVPFAQPKVIGALTMKKLIATIVILVLLLGGGTWLLVTRHRADHATTASESTHTALFHADFATKIGGHAVPVPLWLAQTGAPARRIAGRVMFAKQPMPNAMVRLGVNLGSPHDRVPAMTPGPPFVEVAKVKTNAAGEFDFGKLPAANFVISAEAESTSPVSIGVPAANPHTNTDHLVLVLGDCHLHVTGIVRDSASPIAHARLKIAGLAGADSDATGRFSLCMPTGQYPNIRVEADGYGSVNVQVPPLFGEFRHDVILVPEATIAGSVVDEAGAPVANAVVSARVIIDDGADEASNVDTVADDTGHFQLSGLAPTKYTLGAFSADGASNVHPTIIAVGGVATRDVHLVIVRSARVRGHVTMAGAPVAGATVGIGRATFIRWNTTSAITQPDGSFTLEGVPLGTAEPMVYPYQLVRPAAIKIDRFDVDDVAIEVAATSSVHGRVTRHGIPVAGAQVECSLAKTAATSDSDGTYKIEGAESGLGNLYAHDLKAFTNRPVTLAAGVDQTLDLELEGGGEVRGTVVDEAGAPVPSVLVLLDSHNDDACRALTDARGTFVCATLAGHLDYEPAVYASTTTRRPYEPAGGAFPLVHVADGDAVIENLHLAIKHDQLAIRGKVVDDTGASLPDARVNVIGANEWGDQRRTRADGDGGFVIDGLVAGSYDLRARISDGSQADVFHITAGTSDVVIQLVRPGRVEGTLIGFAQPPWILAEAPLVGHGDIQEAVVSGDHFTLTGLKPGTYQVEAFVDNVQVDGAAVEVRSNTTATVTLKTQSRATIEGRVLELGTNAPLAGMICRASLEIAGSEAANIGGPRGAMTDASGHYTVDAPVGRDRVVCSMAGGIWSNAGGNVDTTIGTTHFDVFAVKSTPPPSNVGFELQPGTMPALVSESTGPLAVGDQLVAIDGISVANLLPDTAMTLAQNHRSAFPVQILRNGTPMTIRIPTH